MTLSLSVLDQSFARNPDQPNEALQETIEMAQHCEALGYERFWVSEHHAFSALAGSAPEVLLAALGAATNRIRLGSGGIMLPHYSTYKVAEVFSLLANLYEQRIDLGVGRAPGADMSTAVALAPDGQPRFHRFPEQVAQLMDYLRNNKARPLVSPKPPAHLPIWMLGSSADSARLAARLGLPYNLGVFINPQADPSLIKTYKQLFQPGDIERPQATLTMGVFCADTEAKARALQLTYDINFYRFVTGQTTSDFYTPQQALAVEMTPQLAAFIAQREATRAVGTPEQVKEKILQLVNEFDADAVMAVTNMYYFEDRKRSFQLLKEAFEE